MLSNHANTRWVLDARYLNPGTNMQFNKVDNDLYIDNVTITLPKNAKQIKVINKQGTFIFDEKNQQMRLINVDGSHFNNRDSLDKYLKMLANSESLS